jgi:triacylglycerol lipase
MSTPAEEEAATLLPARWWGRPLAETRWTLELVRLLADRLYRSADGVPRGDGRPVVLMPGFGAGDQTLAVLGIWLRRLGYAPSVCGFIVNADCSDRALERVARRVDELNRRHGRRVALVGHSRGGHYARALGARSPEKVSHAISLGADLQGQFGASRPTLHAVGAVRRVLLATHRARSHDCVSSACTCGFTRDFAKPFPFEAVRLTSIYSKGDGVVRWEGCVVPGANCVEVTGSHVGLVFNRAAYRAIGDALAQPELA